MLYPHLRPLRFTGLTLAASLAAPCFAQELFPLRQYPGSAGGDLRAVCSADFDGDGLADVAVAGGISQSFDVYFGQPDGSLLFSAAVPTNSGGDAAWIATGDFDNDGMPDVALAVQATNEVEIHLNNGTGAFNFSGSQSTGLDPSRVFAGKFDSLDNFTDLAVLCPSTEEILILRGDGSGGFLSTWSTQPFGGIGSAYLSDLAVGNLNGDSLLDVAIADRQGDRVWFAKSDGIGGLTFTYELALPTGSSGAVAVGVALGDLNGDGKSDLAVLEEGLGQTEVYLGLGNGSFNPVSPAKRADGPMSGGLCVRIHDYNNDGRGDFAVGFAEWTGRSLQVAYQSSFTFGFGYEVNPGFELYLPAGTNVIDFVLADIDGDGDDDFVVPSGTGDSGVTVGLALSQGSYELPVEFYASPVTSAAVLADLNGDGRCDVASSDEFGRILMSYDYDQYPWGFVPSTLFDAPSVTGSPRHMEPGDFNLDGRPDLVTSNDDGKVAFLRNDGTGGSAPGFDNPVYTAVGSQLYHVAVGDVNLDGKPDAVVTEGLNHKAQIMLGTGTGTFTAGAAILSGGWYPKGVALGDLNADGKLDVVTGNEGNGQAMVALGTGGGAFSVPSFYSAPASGAYSVAINDVDGDLILDIIVGNAGWSVLAGSGTGTFGPVTASANGDGVLSIAATDVTGDGKAEIVAAEWGTNSRRISVHENDGTGQFPTSRTYASFFAQTYTKLGLSTGDVNADGQTDFAVSAGFQGAIYLNKRPQPTGLTLSGSGTRGCRAQIGLSGSGVPTAPAPIGYGLTATNVPPRMLGLGIVTNVADAPGSDPFFIGVTLHVNLFASTEIYTLDFVSDTAGNAFCPLPLPNVSTLPGSTYYLQTLWTNPAASLCQPSPFGLSSSKLLEIFIQ